MRLRVVLLVVATSSLVLVSFLVPLALVLRTFAADRAMSTATIQAQNLAPLVTTLDPASLRLAVGQVNAENRSTPVTIFMPGRTELGPPAARTASVQLAARGRSFTAITAAGAEVLVSVQGLPAGTAVIRVFVPTAQLRHGVARAWLLLCALGLGLLALSVLVADQLARSLIRPITDMARAADDLASGDLTARAVVAGSPEVRRASAGLNRLAVRIGELLAHERETVADLSHRLRTPLTALRIDAESLRDDDEMARLSADANAVERTVSEIIREARRPTGEGSGLCDAAEVVTERAMFWQPLAEDQDRPMTLEVAPGPVLVRASAEDLAACIDILLENVFSHTAEGLAFEVRLSRRAGGGAWLVVADDGPGFPDADPTQRGLSSGGSTGLGLDISKQLSRMHGGDLSVQSMVGQGSTFSAWFPRSRLVLPEQPTAPAGETGAAQDGTDMAAPAF